MFWLFASSEDKTKVSRTALILNLEVKGKSCGFPWVRAGGTPGFYFSSVPNSPCGPGQIRPHPMPQFPPPQDEADTDKLHRGHSEADE